MATVDEPRGRDRAATEAAILEAAKRVLATGGFRQLGVNAVAREAGCDKQLIYRYFGGLDGLVAAIGDQLADRVSAGLAANAAPLSYDYADLVAGLLEALIDLLRKDALLRAIAAWEVAEPSPLVSLLAAGRSAGFARHMEALRKGLVPPKDVDFAAVNALLIAGVQHIVLNGAATGYFTGIPLDDAGWERIRAAARKLAEAAYRPA